MDTTFNESAITPKLGEVRPSEIFSHERREIHKKTVTDLMEALARDGRFLQDIAVRHEGATGYRLIAGANRLEAWKRRFGEQRPIPAMIYPPDTSDAQITVLEIEENLLRKELSAAEREAQMIRLAAALKKLNGGKPATSASGSGEAAESGNLIPVLPPASRGRGNKGVAQKVAEKAGVTKRAVNLRLKAASAAIGEKIDLDRDTPEELERKADKRQHAEPKLVRLKRRKPVPGAVMDLWKAFDAIGRVHQLRFIHDACLRLGLDPLKMAPPSVFGLADGSPELAVELPAEVAPTIDATAADPRSEQPVEAADLGPEDLQHIADDVSDDAAGSQPEQGDDAAHPDAGDPYDPGQDVSDHAGVDPEAEQQDDAADVGAEHLLGADDVLEAADQELGGATKCAYCNMAFESGDQRQVVNGRLYHADLCVKYAKPIAIAA